MTTEQMPEDLRQNRIMMGRKEELYKLVHNLRRGRHTILVGEKGVGKTRLMQEAQGILAGEIARIELSSRVLSHVKGKLGLGGQSRRYTMIYVEHPSPLGECLKELAGSLYSNNDLQIPGIAPGMDWKDLKKLFTSLGNSRLQRVILESIGRSSHPYLIFLDNLDRISPAQHTFLEQLLSAAVICTAVVEIKEHFVYKRIWSSFVRIDLEPLSEQTSTELIDYFYSNYPLRISDKQLYQTEIVKASNGNPFLIKTMLWHGSREQFINTREIRTLRRLQEGHYFNMGPVYIFSASVFTIFKIFSLGTDNKEFYIYFSALGVIVYITFRVFRAFFLFRPQKYDR